MDTEKVSRLTRILAEEDPVKLVVMGAPQSEYQPEALRLVEEFSALPTSALTRADVETVVERVFDTSFNVAEGYEGGPSKRLKRQQVGRESLRTSVDRIYAEMVK